MTSTMPVPRTLLLVFFVLRARQLILYFAFCVIQTTTLETQDPTKNFFQSNFITSTRTRDIFSM